METTTLTKTKWQIDPAHSEITFKVRHLMISNVKGSFKEFEGTIDSEDENFKNSEIDVRISTNSITTNDVQRDKHLKSVDFFNMEKHPDIKFKSTGFKSKGDDNFDLTGDLLMNGITQPVKLNVEFGGLMTDPYGNTKAGFTWTGKINRKDWELNWNTALEAGGVLVSDEVAISGEVQLAMLQPD